MTESASKRALVSECAEAGCTYAVVVTLPNGTQLCSADALAWYRREKQTPWSKQ